MGLAGLHWCIGDQRRCVSNGDYRTSLVRLTDLRRLDQAHEHLVGGDGGRLERIPAVLSLRCWVFLQHDFWF